MAIMFPGHSSADENASPNGPQLNVDHYNVSEGLSQSTVTSLVEDQYGYVWIGTLNGLNRFDGKTFKHYFSENNNTSLPSSFIRSLYIDQNGRLLVGTDKGLTVYNQELDQFLPSSELQQISNQAIWSISEYNGTIILGTENNIYLVSSDLLKITNKFELNFGGIKK
ncbi:ligand-binding sensor domain-containing protein [Shewanella colwelliana]